MSTSLTPDQVGHAIGTLSARHGLNLPLLSDQGAREMSWLLSDGMLNLLAVIHHHLPGAKYYLHVTSEVAISDLKAPNAEDYAVKKSLYPFVRSGGMVLTAEGSTTLERLKDAIWVDANKDKEAIQTLDKPVRDLILRWIATEVAFVERLKIDGVTAATTRIDAPRRI